MSSSSLSDAEPKTERTPRSNASSGLLSSCRKLAAETPPLESVRVGGAGLGGSSKTASKHGNRGVAKSCEMLIRVQGEQRVKDTERGKEEASLGGWNVRSTPLSSDERAETGQGLAVAVSVDSSEPYLGYKESRGEFRNPQHGYHDSVFQRNHDRNTNGYRSSNQYVVRETKELPANADVSESVVPRGAVWNPIMYDDENSDLFKEHDQKKPRNNEGRNSTERKLPNDFDSQENEQYITLPASTHTLLHTEPINSVAFLFSLGIAVLSASCLLLVLANEMSKGQKGNLLDVPTGVSTGVRGAQYCGIFVGLLMEEEIPQGLILLRSISRVSFHKTYPELSFTRFILSCLLRLVLGYLFLLNLFVTVVQADDVITIFFDILALEFVLHLDDMAFELGRKDMLGRSLNVATLVEYKVLTREGIKQMKGKHEEENNLLQKQHQHQQRQQEEDVKVAGGAMFYCLRRRKKKIHFRWILKAAYFINLGCLLTGTIILGKNQRDGKYRCKSVLVMFGDQVWENAYVTNSTDPSQSPRIETLVYSYFNGVYKITGTDSHGYPIYTEMNKKSGVAYQEIVGAEIIYCREEEAWVFRHRNISKVDNSNEDEDECLQWLLRSPQSKVYDLIDVPHDDWSVWTGIITPGNKVTILCNVCNHNSDCNYHGECGKNGECNCNPGFYGLHCEFEEFCEQLLDDEGEIYKIVTDTENNTVLSYMRPIYTSRPLTIIGTNASGNLSSEEVSNYVNGTVTLAENSTVDDKAVEEIMTSNPSIAFASSPSNFCYPGAEKVRLESTTGKQIAIFEFEVYSSGINVALQGTATQSSDLYNGEFLDASKAIDGINTTFSHTNDSNAMWEVNLGGLYPIDSVLISNRYCGNNSSDPLGCLCRLSNVTFSLIDETESIVSTKTLGDTCGLLTVSLFFTQSYVCPPTLFRNSTVAHASSSTTLVNEDTNKANSTRDNSTVDDESPQASGSWGVLVLVYSGSRWFVTAEFSDTEEFTSPTLTYNDEYHAFWDELYESRTYFISDPTVGATPVGTDFYENQASRDSQWEDYGPFGLLTPLHNVSGKGYFHCMGTNISAVKVASGTGGYGE